MEQIKEVMPYVLGFGFLLITFIGFWIDSNFYKKKQKEINDFRKANNELTNATKIKKL